MGITLSTSTRPAQTRVDISKARRYYEGRGSFSIRTTRERVAWSAHAISLALLRAAVDFRLTPRQVELVDRARRLALERFAPRADKHDREASFPFEDFQDLRAEGLLALCVPKAYGGLG